MRQFVLGEPKHPTERFPVVVDFSADFTADLPALDAHSVAAKELSSGTDATATLLAGDSHDSAAKTVTVTIQAGDEGKDYLVTFTAATSGATPALRRVATLHVQVRG